ncbi:MAG: dihydroorotate dehydrogenase [Candidatus Omnitrophica bacterium]|nr:dihydroorotate dehydrogenase [Candidatus Omnitrophota bacterium]MBU2044220.1 dihydroorotate dehydrogenase [Candidatus Omnitrophota bacterium]MBU2265608.1 dihydroorotate dehydrogenase [Candidatus Omnitrophota bacterium]
MSLKVKLGKLELSSPLISASGTFGFGEELRGLADFKAIGAITTKTLTLSPRKGNPPPRIYETEQGVVNSIGLENPGVDVFIKDKLPLIRKLPTKCLVSVGGFSREEYQECLTKLDKQKGVDGFEVNLSCPNLRLKKLVSQSAQATYKLTKALRKATRKTLIVKITPEVTDVAEVAKAAERAGADGIALVNTFFSMAINIDTKKPYLGNIYGGYSGRAIKPMSLYRVWKVAGSVRIPVIGGGGIETAQDVIEFILAGATAVSLGTINLVEPNAAAKILKGIKSYLTRKKIKDIKSLRGGLIV